MNQIGTQLFQQRLESRTHTTRGCSPSEGQEVVGDSVQLDATRVRRGLDDTDSQAAMSSALRYVNERGPRSKELARLASLRVVEETELYDMQHAGRSRCNRAHAARCGSKKCSSAKVAGGRHIEQTQRAHSG